MYLKTLKLKIIGKGSNSELKSLVQRDDSIELLGFVEDLTPYYNKSKVMIAPLRFGSGVKVKVFNSMYRGVPLVTTSVGVEGIDIENRKHALVSDTSKGFCAAVVELLNEKDLWFDLVKNSRQLARNKYTWDKNLEPFLRVIGK